MITYYLNIFHPSAEIIRSDNISWVFMSSSRDSPHLLYLCYEKFIIKLINAFI